MRLLTLFFWICCCCCSLFAIETDFDCVVVGTSPISMLEALYKHHTGNRVLIVEQAAECGGAWKSINICGIMHADMGCHEFGNDQRMAKFLEEYVGCKITANAPKQPNHRGTNYGIYPSTGCYELVHNLQRLIEATDIVLLLGHKLESVYIDTAKAIAEVKVKDKRYTTSKLLVTYASEVKIENLGVSQQMPYKAKYPHVYLLIEDPTPSRFTYIHPSAQGVSRAMNVTQFVGLEGTGMQLIAVQVYGENYLNNGEQILQQFKNLMIVDPNARLMRTENYIYEQSYFNMGSVNQLGPVATAMFEVLNTGHILNIGTYAEKWKKALKPFNIALMAP